MPGETGAALRFKPEPVLRIEALEELNATQPRLKNFVLPTGIDRRRLMPTSPAPLSGAPSGGWSR